MITVSQIIYKFPFEILKLCAKQRADCLGVKSARSNSINHSIYITWCVDELKRVVPLNLELFMTI
jgi:hypothetical protein